MPSLDTLRRVRGNVNTVGQVHKQESDIVMEATWDTDIASRVCYLYDYWRDEFKTQLRGLHPEMDKNKIPISLKYIKNATQTYDKDYITYHIQMKPSQECNVPYYEKFFEKRYDAIWPCGLYCDIPDNKGHYNRWLIVNTANFYEDQFSTYEVLACDKVINWVWRGQKIRMAGVLRSQNSYNSGVWRDYKFESPEDQQKFILPLNDLSEKLFYNQRLIIDTKLDMDNGAEPRAWRITKPNRLSPNGLARITLAQDKYDQHNDVVEYEDENCHDPSTIVAIWADYNKVGVDPVDEDPIMPMRIAEITHLGIKPEIKVNGSYEKISVKFYDSTFKDELPFQKGDWSFAIDGKDVNDLLEIKYPEDDDTLDANQIKIKFVGDDVYLGKTLQIRYKSNVDSGADFVSNGSVKLTIISL